MPPVKKPRPRTLEEFVALEKLCVGITTGGDIPQTAPAFDADAQQKARPRSGVQLLNSTRKERALIEAHANRPDSPRLPVSQYPLRSSV
jgi:hypothetical protein